MPIYFDSSGIYYLMFATFASQSLVHLGSRSVSLMIFVQISSAKRTAFRQALAV